MASEDAGNLLRRHRLRSTPQRRAILDAFRGSPSEHLSAEEVLARAVRAVPDLGRGTVYATLAELSEVGLLGSVGSTEPVRYETNVTPHDHFRCRLCERLFDVVLGGPPLRRRRLDGFQIESITVHAEGTCRDCGEYLRGLGDGAARIGTEPTLGADALRTLACDRVTSPVGELGIAASAEGIVRVAFSDHADYTLIDGRVRSRRGPADARPRLRALAGTLERYFDGDRTAPEDLLDWRLSPLADRLGLEAVRRIPYGGTRSYERLVEESDPYLSGRLIGANPLALLVPCHRVSRGSEHPTAYVGGADRLQILLELEAGTPA